ncbi:LysR family transcriptional regulator [Limimaricola cinnabarinus]|jgi:molybdenum-dependent DNA-binding transcriptional regulator ModE|uniref:HTH lysR-type domain-containing protein n=1 Tax=Limimaricola cinnabarinus TaxID=1125964 RepID=A0A2G1MG74_9RHOB|nr:LysR family transcriptional regulator [Limimaricola cinnabarinus]PHP27687.1 hypothetical protein CJ301_09840 [Limimaricola cinnabarinus]
MNRLDCDRMFVAVMETGSFAGAAEKLRTSSGQASKLVSRLEAELGVRLLNRTTRAVSATEAGRAYHDRLRPLLDAFDELDLSIRDISQTPTGRLRVSAPLTFGALALVPILLGSIYVPHGAAGFFFSNEGGGWEFPAFWAVTLVVQALLGDGAYALKRNRG